MTTYQKPTALITDASQGIGEELAILYAQQGGNVVLVDRSEAKLHVMKLKLERFYSTQVTGIVADLSRPNTPQKVYSATQSRRITIDCLINNTDFSLHGKPNGHNWQEKQKDIMQVNMVSVTELTHLFLKGMVIRKRGKILNVTTEASSLPEPLQPVYEATRAYLTSFIQSIAEKNKMNNVMASEVCSEFIHSNLATVGNFVRMEAFKRAKHQDDVSCIDYKDLLVTFLGAWPSYAK